MLPGKKVISGSEARRLMKSGIDQLANVVKVTLGPKGKNVNIRQYHGGVVATKDGVTVAREFSLEDPAEDMGAQLCKQAAMKTNELAGDGTSSATVLAQALVESANRALGTGADANSIKRGIDRAVEVSLESIDGLKVPITIDDLDKVTYVASVSANDPVAGSEVANAYAQVGSGGVVSLETAKSKDTTVRLVEGMKWDYGFIAPHFVNTERMTCEFDEPYLFFWEKGINNAQELIEFLTGFLKFAGGKSKSLVIICESAEGDALATMIANKMDNGLRIAAVKAPGFGERRKGLMEDMAVFCGGKFYSEEMGQSLAKFTDFSAGLGSCKKIVIKSGETTIFGGAGKPEDLANQIEKLKSLAEQSDSKYDQDKYSERIAKLTQKIAIISVGGSNEVEIKEKKYRYEDAINATKAALEFGIVPGGGTACLHARAAVSKLMEASDLTPDELIGVKAVWSALDLPLQTICENGGLPGQVYVAEVMKNISKDAYYGFNAKTNEFGNMLEMGIIDPVKVTKSALSNAAAIAGTFVMTEVLMFDVPEDKE